MNHQLTNNISAGPASFICLHGKELCFHPTKLPEQDRNRWRYRWPIKYGTISVPPSINLKVCDSTSCISMYLSRVLFFHPPSTWISPLSLSQATINGFPPFSRFTEAMMHLKTVIQLKICMKYLREVLFRETQQIQETRFTNTPQRHAIRSWKFPRSSTVKQSRFSWLLRRRRSRGGSHVLSTTGIDRMYSDGEFKETSLLIS